MGTLGMDPSVFDIATGNYWITQALVLMYYIAFGWIPCVFLIYFFIRSKPLTAAILPCVGVAFPFGVSTVPYFSMAAAYSAIHGPVFSVFAYIISFSFIPGIWFVVAGFRKQVRWKAIVGLLVTSYTLLPFITMLNNIIN